MELVHSVILSPAGAKDLILFFYILNCLLSFWFLVSSYIITGGHKVRPYVIPLNLVSLYSLLGTFNQLTCFQVDTLPHFLPDRNDLDLSAKEMI